MSIPPIKSSMTVDEWLDSVDYSERGEYIPSVFALEFITFIKLVNGTEGEENKTPVLHMKMLDGLVGENSNLANLLYRGSGKTTLMGEYMFLYLAVYGELPGWGDVEVALYVSDSIENGVKNMRKNVEHRWENSEFLKKYVPTTKFTDVRMEFTNLANKKLIVKMYGAKALSLDTKLFTNDGYTTIKDCKVGDMIFGPDGNLHPITAKSEVFNKKMYELILGDGRKLKVSEDHINNVIMNTNPNNLTRYEEKNLTTKELLSEKLIHTRTSKRGTSSKHLVWIKNTEPMQYSEKDFSIDPYLLGLMLGDGSIRKDGSCVLHGEMADIEFYKQHIDEKLGSEYLDKRNGKVISLSIKNIYSRFEKLDLRGIKMSEKFVPDIYKFGSIEQRLSLLQGLLDTDGTISKTSRISFSNTSPQLIKDVQDIVRSLGGIAYEPQVRNATDRWATAYKIEILMPTNPFRLERKANRWFYRERQKQMVPLHDIVEIAEEPSQCIAIGSNDHLYLAGDYITTHNTGVRGSKEMAQRPNFAILDDLVSDEDARSPTIIASIEDTVYKAIDYALHPKRSKTIWNGTPFNQNDPLYKAIESGAWHVSVYPVCEHFDEHTTEETFRGAWPDRHDFAYVKRQYEKAKRAGKLDSFMQELMLRITSDEDRLVRDVDMKKWFDTEDVTSNEGNYNFYITTDFATSEKERADYSVISCWAYNSNDEWMLIDGALGRNLMDKNIDLLFDFVVKYDVRSVGIEVTGQQGAFVTWIRKEMHKRNTYFTIIEVRPSTDKLKRFHTVVPLFRQGKIWFNKDLIGTNFMKEAITELERATVSGFKSRHDDFLDTVSMLAEMRPWKPQHYNKLSGHSKWDDPFFEEPEEEIIAIGSYIV